MVQARVDPGAVYGSPLQVVEDPGLSLDVKIDILQRWAYDEAELLVAEEEGMAGGETSRMAEVREALRKLGADTIAGPTKHGG